jgi:hypothetical protein
MATRIIADDSMVYAMLAQLPRRQTGALITRSGFIHPNMKLYASLVRRVYWRECCTNIHRGPPTRISVSKHIEDLGIFCWGLLNEG